MPDFIWTNELSIGVDAMDKDHQIIINYMNALTQADERNASFQELDAAFTKLINFTVKHFEVEEKYMESLQFDELNTHKLIHKKLISRLSGHYDEFKANRTLDEKVFSFLTFWLKSHICGIDKKYGLYANKANAA